jgi:hypothetical protein
LSVGGAKVGSGMAGGLFPGNVKSVFGAKSLSKGCLLEIPKIGNGTKIELFGEDRHRDLLKTVLGSGSEKT